MAWCNFLICINITNCEFFIAKNVGHRRYIYLCNFDGLLMVLWGIVKYELFLTFFNVLCRLTCRLFSPKILLDFRSKLFIISAIQDFITREQLIQHTKKNGVRMPHFGVHICCGSRMKLMTSMTSIKHYYYCYFKKIISYIHIYTSFRRQKLTASVLEKGHEDCHQVMFANISC